jgi:hypothetical protein
MPQMAAATVGSMASGLLPTGEAFGRLLEYGRQERCEAPVLRPVLVAAAVLVGACSDRQAAAGRCQPAPPPEAGAKAAIDRITDEALRDAIAGKAVIAVADRTAARRRVVVACLHRSAYLAARSGSQAEATEIALADCASVIDRFVKAEAVEAALGGGAIPDPGTMADLRGSFHAEAAGKVREAKAGRCWRGLA